MPQPITRVSDGRVRYSQSGRVTTQIPGTPEWRRERKLWEYYHLTFDDYYYLLERQGGVCAICGQEETMRDPQGNIRPLCVDHDHDGLHVRGLLCTRCNTGIGYLGDSPDRLRAAAEYLENRGQ